MQTFTEPNSIIQTSVVAKSFTQAASGYDGEPLKFLKYSAEFLIKNLALRTPQKVLDVATGTGKAAILSAPAVLPAGFVTAVDISEGMLQKAKYNATQAAINNIEFIQTHSEKLDFEDESFDVTLCSSGIYIMRDIPQCLREWKRVTKKGGRVAFSTFGKGILEPMMSMFESSLRSYGVKIYSPSPLYRLNKKDDCQILLESVGLHDIKVFIKQGSYYIPSAKEWIDIIKNSGFRIPLERLEQKYLNQFIEEHEEAVSQLSTNKGIYLETPIIIAIGKKI
ncbi:MAG: class I SAM-dependent methyltransferase [Candidatus Parabeggiatoa sp.]|nr:class I SAM-dependent methyltransferase [Candidatus Parabeggiatoa sp.]